VPGQEPRSGPTPSHPHKVPFSTRRQVGEIRTERFAAAPSSDAAGTVLSCRARRKRNTFSRLSCQMGKKRCAASAAPEQRRV